MSKKKLKETLENMQDDLMTVLESYMDELEMQDVFFYSLAFMTFTAYECLEDHKLSLKIVQGAVENGISQHIALKDEDPDAHHKD